MFGIPTIAFPWAMHLQLTKDTRENNVGPPGQATKPSQQKLSYRELRDLERMMKVFLAPPQDGLRVNPTDHERYAVINGVEGEEEFNIGYVSSGGRYFSRNELIAKVTEILPKRKG